MPPWGRQCWAVIQLYEKKKANHAKLLYNNVIVVIGQRVSVLITERKWRRQ